VACLFVVDDDRSVVHIFRRCFADSDIEVVSAGTGAEALEAIDRYHPDVVMLDIVLPDESGLVTFERIHGKDPTIPVVFITATGTSSTAIEAIKLGAFDYLLKPLDLGKIRALVGQALKIRRFMHVPVQVSVTPQRDHGADGDVLVGRCPAMQEVYKAIGRVASQNVAVLIRGESGTGKELVACAIYQHSPRASGRFLAVNCAAIPEPLLESELFGHEKGAFTGADTKRIGKFEQCNGGTLFLDEVGDMTPLMQSKVLRVLQEQHFERVGGNQTIETNVWIIAATNRDLEQMVAHGQFRADLYYRLNGFAIKLPALRERVEDIPILVEHFLARFNRELRKGVCKVSPEALELLMRYPWPGNVRELQSVLKQALLQTTGLVLLADFLPHEVRNSSQPFSADSAVQYARPAGIEDFVEDRLRTGNNTLYAESVAFMERILFARVLRHTQGNQSRAAKILGITRGSLRSKIRLLGITINQAVNVEEESSSDESSTPAPVV
jgi:two-component system nitrogen regulation response regulator GlnG